MLLDNNGVYSYINLKNALLVPSFPTSLFSVRAAADAGAKVVFTQNMSALSIGNTHFDIRRQGNLYFLPTYQHEQIFTSANTTKTLQEWHRVLGHMNKEDIERLEKVTNGMNIIKSGSCEKICDVCIENKITKQPKSKDIPNIKATHPLERVHSDVCGPINPSSREGFKYIINFVDEYSGMLFVYILRSKNEATTALKNFLSDISPYGKVKGIHTDNGGEYISEDFQSVLRNNNIHHSTTSPHSSYQNGKAERSWRSLMEMARCLTAEASISKQFWPYAVRHAQYLRNRSFQRLSQKTAFELFTGSKPDLRKLHIFGSKCTFYVEGPKQKLDSRGQSGLYLGVQARSNSYVVLNPQNNKIIISRNVVVHNDTVHDIDDTFHDAADVNEGDNQLEKDNVSESETSDDENLMVNNRPIRQNKHLPRHLDDYYVYSSTCSNVDFACKSLLAIPVTYKDAITSTDSDKWKSAMDAEIATLEANDTYELVNLPPDRTETKGRWVYTIKQGKIANEIQYKARYVAKGYSQVPGVDFDETFSPTTIIFYAVKIMYILSMCQVMTIWQTF